MLLEIQFFSKFLDYSLIGLVFVVFLGSEVDAEIEGQLEKSIIGPKKCSKGSF